MLYLSSLYESITKREFYLEIEERKADYYQDLQYFYDIARDTVVNGVNGIEFKTAQGDFYFFVEKEYVPILECYEKIEAREIRQIQEKIHANSESNSIEIYINHTTKDLKYILDKLDSLKLDEPFNSYKLKVKDKVSNFLSYLKYFGKAERKLTPDICALIAKFKINNKPFVSSLQGGVNIGDALYYLLKPSKDVKKTDIKIGVENWDVKDIQYLLYKISENVIDKIVISDIESKRCLYLKNGNLFSRGSYDTFKSQKLEGYITTDPNRPIIDNFVNELFS